MASNLRRSRISFLCSSYFGYIQYIKGYLSQKEKKKKTIYKGSTCVKGYHLSISDGCRMFFE